MFREIIPVFYDNLAKIIHVFCDNSQFIFSPSMWHMQTFVASIIRVHLTLIRCHVLETSYCNADSFMKQLLWSCRSQWPRGLRSGCAAVQFLRLWVRIPPVHGCLFLVSAVCFQVEVPASGWSLVQRSPTECGVSNWVRSWSLDNGEALAH